MVEFSFNGTITKTDGSGTATELVGTATQGITRLFDTGGTECFTAPGGPLWDLLMLRNDLPAGMNQVVEPLAGAEITFAEVTQAGTVSVVPLTEPDGEVSASFQLFDVPIYFDVSTTASFLQEVTVCLPYPDEDNDGNVDNTDPLISVSALRVLHEEAGVFVDRTKKDSLDTAKKHICAEVTEFSQFVLAGGGALAYWPLDDGSGSVAADASGNDHDGTLVNEPMWSGFAQVGGALSFDGENDFVELADPGVGWLLDISDQLTIALWVYPEELAGHQSLLSKDDTFELEIGLAGDGVYSVRFNNLRQGAGETGLESHTWQHLALSWDGQTVRYYYDGQPDGSTEFSGSLLTNDQDIGLGARPLAPHSGGPVFFFDGLLDEVRLYDRALTPQEVLAVYTATGSPEPPDVMAPLRFAGAPAEILPAGTHQATLALSTGESATCRYADNEGVAFSDMVETFSTTGGTLHTSTVSGLVDEEIYTFYVRCRDTVGNLNSDDFAIVFAVSSQSDIAAGLMAHLPLDENTGCLATDSTGNGADGLLGPICPDAAPQWTDGFLQSGLLFAGGDDEVLIPASTLSSPLDQLTLAAWVRQTPSSQFRAILDKRSGSHDGYDLYIDPSSRLFMRVNDATLVGETIVADSTWHHVVGVYDGSQIVLYVDGLRDAAATVGSISLGTTSDLHIGRHWLDPHFSLAGKLDEVRIYDRGLSAIEVLDLYLWNGAP